MSDSAGITQSRLSESLCNVRNWPGLELGQMLDHSLGPREGQLPLGIGCVTHDTSPQMR